MTQEVEPNSRIDFGDRFYALCQEAKRYGFSSAFVIVQPACFDEADAVNAGFEGSYYAVAGALAEFPSLIRAQLEE